ncbi:MAG: helicase-related protein [Brooklawnia sp.]
MDRVTYQEHRDPVEVFNLSVEGVPHFFAGGVLTHNCTAYKKYGTRRWKFLRPLAEKTPFLWMLTGTPAVQYPLDAFGQVKLMYQHWDMSETRFKMATMVQINKYRWVPLDDSQDTIYAVMQPAIKVAKRDVLKDLPPVMHSTRDVEMTAEQKAAMKELRKQAIAEVGNSTITAVHAAAMRVKLVQIASGVVYDDNRNEVQVDYKDRFDELCEIVTQVRDEAPKTGPIGGKFIVLAAFTHTVERLAKDLAAAGLRVAMLHGGVSLSRRTEIVRQFQETRDIDGVIAIPDVMSHGLTLTAANTTVWFTPIDKAEVALQANNRMDRPGQIQHMHIIRLCGCEAERVMYDAMDRRFDYHTDLVSRYKDFVDAL